MAQEFTHVPVLLSEVTDLFRPVDAGVIVDATLGGGGHASSVLKSRNDLGVFGIDRDQSARRAATVRLGEFGERAVIADGRFSELRAFVSAGSDGTGAWPRIPGVPHPAPVVGILADLGVSSPQLDLADRGFSFLRGGPLDMRMNQEGGETATEILDRLDLDQLTQLLREHGEGRYARRIARAILAARPIETTTQLVEVVDGAVPRGDRRRGNVASRVFQALRVTVNSEDAELATLLDDALSVLAPGGRIAVISYHSGEDALVKHTFRRWAEGDCSCPSHLPCVWGASSKGELISRRAIQAGEREVALNPRASSGRLRCCEVGR